MKDFYENKITDFLHNIGKSKLIPQQSGKLVWEDFSHSFIAQACPNCSLSSLQLFCSKK